MSTDSRLLSLLDDHDPFHLDPSLRIPPLHDPLPFIPSRRPSPLEPNARVNDGTHSATAKLTSRRKALPEANPIGVHETSAFEVAREVLRQQAVDSGDEKQGPQKRRKTIEHGRITDFVQLPKPTSKIKAEKPPPFKPVPILNQLHEPPPSAALFPPITPNTPQEGAGPSLYDRHQDPLPNMFRLRLRQLP